jgi:two-component system, OmpR family, sensor histidine kinase KdpD
MVFMLLVLYVTVWFGLGTGFIMAVFSFLFFDYFFISPFSFLGDIQSVLTVFLFLGVALAVNQVSGQARFLRRQAEGQASEIAALYDLNTLIITGFNQDNFLEVVVNKVCTTLETDGCSIYLNDNQTGQELSPVVQVGTERSETSFDYNLVRSVYRDKKPLFLPAVWQSGRAGRFPWNRPETKILTGPVAYLPLETVTSLSGVMALGARSLPGYYMFNSGEIRLLQIFTSQVAMAVDHIRLVEQEAKVSALHESDRLKTALLAAVSHDFRTPLTTLKTAISILSQTGLYSLPDENEEILRMMDQEVERLVRMVTNLLDLSKIEGGTLKPDFGQHYLPEIITAAVERLKRNGLLTAHDVSMEFSPQIPLARLDYLQIERVVSHLLENAAKFSPPGSSIEVKLSLMPPRPAGEPAYLECVVLDRGPGIPPDQLEKIFDKFYMVTTGKNDFYSKKPGSGVGLAIVKGIIEAHGGRAWAENRIGRGTAFYFRVPSVPLDSSEEATSLD